MEAFDSKLLDAVPDLLPASAKGSDLGSLREGGARSGGGGRGRWLVCAGFADAEQVGPGHVHGAEGELLGDGVDVGCLVDHGGVLAAKDGVDPLGGALPASDETLRSKLQHVSNCSSLSFQRVIIMPVMAWHHDIGASVCDGGGVTYDASGWVDRATQRVDSDDMWCLLVPGSIFAPVARRDFFPRVVEVDGLLEVFHGGRVPRVWSRAPLRVDVASSRGDGVDMVCRDKGRGRRGGVRLSTGGVVVDDLSVGAGSSACENVGKGKKQARAS